MKKKTTEQITIDSVSENIDENVEWVRVEDVKDALADFELHCHNIQVISPKITSTLLKHYFKDLLGVQNGKENNG